MSVASLLSCLALRPVVVGLCETLGAKVVGSAAEMAEFQDRMQSACC